MRPRNSDAVLEKEVDGDIEIPKAPVRKGFEKVLKRIHPENMPDSKTAKASVKSVGRRSSRVLEPVRIPPIETAVTELHLVGMTPLIVNNFGKKAIDQILEKQLGKAKGPREKKNPFEDFLGSLYILPGAKVKGPQLQAGESWPYMKNTFGFPCSGFKGAVVSACTFVSGVPKTIVRGALHVLGDFAPLQYKRLVMRQDVVRVGPFGRRVADIRFRGEFQDWEVVLKVRYDVSLLTVEQIVNLFQRAGFAVGVGEWRPEKNGSWGTFSVR